MSGGVRLLRGRRTPGPAAADGGSTADHLARPRLHDGIRVHPPLADGEPWLLQRGEHQYFRVGADLAALAAELDGGHGPDGLAARLGDPWSPASVRKAIGVLDGARLLVRPDDAPPRRRRRLTYVPPLTLQFTVLRSGDALARRINGLRLCSPRVLAALVAVLGVAGAFTLVGQRARVAEALSTPVSLGTLVAVLAAVSVTTVAHELGHACLLAYYGARPGRLGVMVFYLSPAMFCDVSDAWRLNHRQRARVALAGILVQVGVSGAASCSAAFAGRGAAGDALLLFALVNAAAAMLNVLPFVKLDGYIALMSYLDRPNLRATAMRSVRQRFVRLLTGGPRPDRDGQPPWLPWFGAACAVLPILLVVRGLGQWLDALLSLGYFGLTLSAALGGLLVAVAAKSLSGVVRDLRATPPKVLRLAVLGVVVAALCFGASLVRLGTSEIGAYRVHADGSAVLLAPNVNGRPVRAGDRVELVEAGTLLRRPLGKATVVAPQGPPTAVPLTGMVPVRADDVKVPGRRFVLRVDGQPAAAVGSVRLHPRSVSLPRWVYERFVQPFSALFP